MAGGIETERTQNWFDFAFEITRQRGVRRLAPLAARQDDDAGCTQRWHQHFVQARVLARDQSRGAFVDGRQLLLGGHAVRTALGRAHLDQLLDAGDANLEELVEIARRDAQELQALEQRHALIERLREHAGVELQ
jgi:hypothetical protein